MLGVCNWVPGVRLLSSVQLKASGTRKAPRATLSQETVTLIGRPDAPASKVIASGVGSTLPARKWAGGHLWSLTTQGVWP